MYACATCMLQRNRFITKYRMMQKSLDTRGNMLTTEYQMTSMPPRIREAHTDIANKNTCFKTQHCPMQS